VRAYDSASNPPPGQDGEGTIPPHVDPRQRRYALSVLRLERGLRVSKKSKESLNSEALRGDPVAIQWQRLAEYVEVSVGIMPPESRAKMYLDGLQATRPDDSRVMRLIMASVREEVEAKGLEAEHDGPPPFEIGAIGSFEFARQKYLREWLIKKILVKGQACVVGGPKKGLKTTQVIDLMISLASGGRFLGVFDIPRKTKVLMISGESGEATIQETARRICRSKGIDIEDLEGYAFWGFNLPKLDNPEQMAALAKFIEDNGIECVIVDPLYLCLVTSGGAVDPANLFSVGPLLSGVTRICLDAGATPILVHHLRKNREDPYSPPDLEDLAFAGIQEFARQWIMIGRREAYEPGSGEHPLWLSVGGSAGHSGAWAVDISEGTIGDDFEERRWEVRVTGATEARAETREQEQAAKEEQAAEKTRRKEEVTTKRVRDDAVRAAEKLEKVGPTSKTDWKSAMLGWDSPRFNSAFAWLAENGWIEPFEVTRKAGKGTRSVEGFRACVPRIIPFGAEPGSNPDRTRIEPGFFDSDPYPDRTRMKEDSLPLKGESLSDPGSDPGSDAETKEPTRRGPQTTHKNPGSKGAAGEMVP
jgi:hypothetical protein